MTGGLIDEVFPEKTVSGRICPLRAIAYTIARIPDRIQEATCIGERCAWYVQNCGCCAVKMFAVP